MRCIICNVQMIPLCQLKGIPDMPRFESNSSAVGFSRVDFLLQSGINMKLLELET